MKTNVKTRDGKKKRPRSDKKGKKLTPYQQDKQQANMRGNRHFRR